MEIRKQTDEAMRRTSEVIKEAYEEFREIFGRGDPSPFIEEYMCDDAEIILVGMGTLAMPTRVAVRRMREAGKKVGERVWRMPLGEEYDKMLKSDIADMKNISGGRGGGSITAAQFLGRFVGRTPWAHLDIAGVTWAKKDLPMAPKGATAFGVRLLDRLVADHYEKK